MSRSIPLLMLLVGCSLGRNPAKCESDDVCRNAFGLGSVCASDGFCAEPAPPARCLDTEPADIFQRPEKYADRFVIGGMFNLETDQPQSLSTLLAIRQVNDLGGLDGGSFAAVVCTYEEDTEYDDLDEAGATEQIVGYLVDTLGASAIIGPSTSDRAFDAYAAAEPLGAVIVSPSATSPTLTEVDGVTHDDENPGLFWRTVPPDDLQGVTMAWDLDDRGVTDVALVHQESSYATSLAAVFLENYAGNVSTFTFSNPTTLSEAITDAGNAAPQEVVFLTSDVSDIVSFFGAVAVSSDYNGPDPIEIFLADAGSDPFLLQNTQDVSGVLYGRVRGTRPQIPQGDVFEQFQAAYAAAYGEDPSNAVFAAYTYDATWLAMYGHAWAWYQLDEISGFGIAQGMRQVSDPAQAQLPVRPSAWQTVVEKFGAGFSVNLEGASGPLDFDDVTGETTAAIEVWVIDAGGTGFEPVTVCLPDGTCIPA